MNTRDMSAPVVISPDTVHGGLVYPFLPQAWHIVTRRFENGLEAIAEAEAPTLRWVKDSKVLDLYIPDMDTETYLAQTGLSLSMAKGGYVLSKRLSRIMRPYRYYGFFDAESVTIEYSNELDGDLWDGSGLVSRAFVERLAEGLLLEDRHRRELLHSGRLEVTTLHAGGQDKGHVLVVDDLSCDFLFPAESAKTELSMANDCVFVGFQPVHSRDEMVLDIQSLINLYPFFQPEHLLAWAGMESELFLDRIADGRLEALLNRLYDADSVSDLDSLANWHVGEYIASGGSLMWFAGLVKAVAKQHLNRLGSRSKKLRCVVPGGRYYIFPAAVGGRDVPTGHIELDPSCATAWVNDGDWLDYIVDVLGGCDGDDALWIFPFSDRSDDNAQKILAWRSPNQCGEYVVLKPTVISHTLEWATSAGVLSYPSMDSTPLPPRVDKVDIEYGELVAQDAGATTAVYTPSALWPTIQRANHNRGVLGGYCKCA